MLYLVLEIFLWKLPMEQCFVNENFVIENNETIEICVNDEIMEENVNVQTETNRNPKNEREEQMKIIATLTLVSWPKQGLAKVRVKNEA